VRLGRGVVLQLVSLADFWSVRGDDDGS